MSSFTVIVPTFKETDKIRTLLACFKAVENPDVRVYIPNGNPGDQTSDLLSGPGGDPRVLELKGNPSLFWSGLVNIGLRRVLSDSPGPDFVVLMNADIRFDPDLFSSLERVVKQTGSCQIGALCHNGKRVLSSGTRVRSWLLALTRHPFAGYRLTDLPPQALAPVDFLPTRCTAFPMEAVRKAGLVAERQLPHYGADNEYTLRLKRMGYPPFISADIRIACDMGHTGNSVYHKNPSLWMRLKKTGSIKSVYNPRIRSRFICMTYPLYARPTALLMYGIKGLAEVLLGGAFIRNLFRSQEHGFSGTDCGAGDIPVVQGRKSI